jgi:chorismate mutase
MRVSREIGTFKKEHNMQVLQATRYGEILEGRVQQAEKFGIDASCMQKILEIIHEESVRQQIEIINKA